MKKKFELPELIIIYFEDDLATDIVSSGQEPTDVGGDNPWDDLP